MEIDILSASQRDEILATHLRAHLTQLGLKEITVRKWVEGSQPPVRRLFELQLTKGTIKACWGFSLDFVPHISAGRVRWHRSDKTAMLDVILDPRHLSRPSWIRGAARFSDDLSVLLPEALREAQATWARGSSYARMLEIVREIRDRPIEQRINCFGFDNYTQLPLTFAFLSAKLGDLPSAETELAKYVTRFNLDDDEAAKLRGLATEYAAGR